LKRARWQMPPQVPQEQLAAMDLPPLMVQLLHNRGITDRAQAESFLAADEHLLNDPFLLPDMDKAVSRIYSALLSGEKIAIYGDFDADGMTATAILSEGISFLGGTTVPYIPHRVEEGYGLNHAAVQRLHGEGVSLIITVDCGISNADEVDRARSMGLDIVITDHHTVPERMPQAVAVVNPKRADSDYPFPKLAGVGVAFKLLQALFGSLGKDGHIDSFLDLVAFGTVADMEPLLGENRYLVKRGLEMLRATKRPGLREMAKCAGVSISSVDPDVISWSLGPRLNAAGRLEHAMAGYDILLTDSVEEAQRLAKVLEGRNSERQKVTEAVLAKARQKLLARGTDSPILMVGDEDFRSGVVGVVAGRLAEEFYRPVIVLEQGKKWSKGSARSIREFDIIAALTSCSSLLYRFGGHPMAAGCTVATENLEQLETCLCRIASEEISSLDLRPLIPIDAEIPLSTLDGSTFQMMQKLAPFGTGNPYPTFVSRDISVVSHRNVGADGKHLKFKLRDGKATWDGIGFRLGSLADEVVPLLDIVYNVELDQWRGRETLQLNILDFAPAS